MITLVQDRVIFHRLENICHCVEKGEWPVNHRYFLSSQVVQGDSQSSTPVPDTPATGSSTPVQTIDYSLPPSSERLVSFQRLLVNNKNNNNILFFIQ